MSTSSAVPLARARGRGRTRARLPRLGVLILLGLVALVFAIPFYWVLLSSVKTVGELRAIPPTWWPETFTLDNFPHAWSGKFGRYMINSFVYAGLSTVVITFTSSLIGYVLIKDRS